MDGLGLLAAFLGGVLALLSPCSALLLPSFFAYAFQHRTQLIARTALFYAGLAAVLVPLGTGTALVSHVFYGHRHLLVLISGWAIIAFGVMQITGRGFGLRSAGVLAGRAAGRGGSLAMVGLGAAYGLSGFCAGPILGAVLTMAAAGGQAVHGGVLLAVYALGMAAPLFVLAALWTKFGLGTRRWLRGRELHVGPLHPHSTSLISGLLFIGIGVVFLRYDATAGITGAFGLKTTGLEYTLQNWAISFGNHVSNTIVLVVVGAVSLLAAVWRIKRHAAVVRSSPSAACGIRDPGDEQLGAS
ncbi:MAG: cytochrome c biogenesis protein CcdA [Solirubrobacteraceae bacterium]